MDFNTDIDQVKREVRNKLRRYSLESILNAALSLLHRRFPTPDDEIPTAPWLTLLIAEWALEDKLVYPTVGKVISLPEFLTIHQRLWNLGGKGTSGLGTTNIVRYLRSLAYVQMQFQRLETFEFVRWPALLGQLTADNPVRRDFETRFGLTPEDFLDLVFAIYSQFLKGKGSLTPDYLGAMHLAYGEKLDTMLGLLARDVPSLRDALSAEGRRAKHSAQAVSEFPVFKRFPLVRSLNGTYYCWHPKVFARAVDEFVHTQLVDEGSDYSWPYSKVFEDYVVELSKTTELPYLDEQSFWDVVGTDKHAVEIILQDGGSNVFVEAKFGYWAAWFWLRYRQTIALPVPVAAIQQFVVDHVERRTRSGLVADLPVSHDQALVDGGFKGKLGTLALAPVLHRLSVLSKAHQVRGVANTVQDAKVRDLVAKTRRAYAKRGVVPDKKAAITLEPLQAMLATCDDSLRGVRDRALLLFAWSGGGRRRSEVTDATMENTRRVGPRARSFTLLHSKTNQTGELRADSEKPILEEAADALATWISRAGLKDGPVFRRVRRGDKIGEPLAPAAVREIVLARTALAGLEPEFAAHSLRSGFVTEAARQNVPMGEATVLTGHTSSTSLVRYYRAAETRRSAGATLLRASKPMPEPDTAKRTIVAPPPAHPDEWATE